VDRTVTTVIDPDLCTGCGLCIPVCPSDTLAMQDGKAVVVGAESLQCGHCQAVCPVGAIRVGALDPAMETFASFAADPAWQPPGKADPTVLVGVMASRRSCRNFRDDPVPREVLEDLVKAACLAPSGTNCQSWTFTVLPDRAAVLALGGRCLAFFERLCDLSDRAVLRLGLRLLGRPELDEFHRGYAPKVRESIRDFREKGIDRLFHGAPAVVVIGSLHGASTPREDALLAAQNLLLAAHALGYATCLVGFAVEAMAREPSLSRALGLPRGHRVHAVVAVGRSAERYRQVTGRLTAAPRFVDAASMGER
jgi:nitroreductase/NAD-dependent dihydropyrimidine dehydrogenase PreA subunit